MDLGKQSLPQLTLKQTPQSTLQLLNGGDIRSYVPNTSRSTRSHTDVGSISCVQQNTPILNQTKSAVIPEISMDTCQFQSPFFSKASQMNVEPKKQTTDVSNNTNQMCVRVKSEPSSDATDHHNEIVSTFRPLQMNLDSNKQTTDISNNEISFRVKSEPSTNATDHHNGHVFVKLEAEDESNLYHLSNTQSGYATISQKCSENSSLMGKEQNDFLPMIVEDTGVEKANSVHKDGIFDIITESTGIEIKTELTEMETRDQIPMTKSNEYENADKFKHEFISMKCRHLSHNGDRVKTEKAEITSQQEIMETECQDLLNMNDIKSEVVETACHNKNDRHRLASCLELNDHLKTEDMDIAIKQENSDEEDIHSVEDTTFPDPLVENMNATLQANTNLNRIERNCNIVNTDLSSPQTSSLTKSQTSSLASSLGMSLNKPQTSVTGKPQFNNSTPKTNFITPQQSAILKDGIQNTISLVKHKHKRRDLSLADKFEVVKLLDQKLSQTEISKIIGISQSQVSQICRNRDKIKLEFESNANPKRKRFRLCKAPDVEQALSTWFKGACAQNLPISGAVLEQKALDLARLLNKEDFKPSAGWLSRWKAKNAISFKCRHGEQRHADTTAAENWLQNVLPEFLKSYSPDDIYNADEIGLYFRAVPKGTLFKNNKIKVHNKNKDRITVMVACNMSGTDKRRLLVIGKSKDPRSFRGKSLPVVYKDNKSTWMTSEIFTNWLSDFNRVMRSQGRNILLLVNNCSAHPQKAALKMDNINLKFLPKNTTSFIQPCGQGIIRNLKALYRSQVISTFVKKINADTTITADALAKQISLLDTVKMLAHAWGKVTPTTIQCCFAKGGFVLPTATEAGTEHLGDCNVAPPDCMTEQQFNTFLDVDANVQCHGWLTDSDICSDVLSNTQDVSEDDNQTSDDSGDESDQLPCTLSEARASLKQVRRYLKKSGWENFKSFYQLKKDVEEAAKLQL